MSQLFQANNSSTLFTYIEADNTWVGELSDVCHKSPVIPVQVTFVLAGQAQTLLKKESHRRDGELLWVDYYCPETGASLRLYND